MQGQEEAFIFDVGDFSVALHWPIISACWRMVWLVGGGGVYLRMCWLVNMSSQPASQPASQIGGNHQNLKPWGFLVARTSE